MTTKVKKEKKLPEGWPMFDIHLGCPGWPMCEDEDEDDYLLQPHPPIDVGDGCNNPCPWDWVEDDDPQKIRWLKKQAKLKEQSNAYR